MDLQLSKGSVGDSGCVSEALFLALLTAYKNGTDAC